MQQPTPEEKELIAHHLFAKEGEFIAFFRLYHALISQGRDLSVSVASTPSPGSVTHQHVLGAVDMLKENIIITKLEAIQTLREPLSLRVLPTDSEAEKVIDLAVQSMIMVDCSAKRWHAADYMLGGYRPTSWDAEETFSQFIHRSLPVGSQSSELGAQIAIEGKTSLKAWKLEKRLGVKFRGTDNLSEHLLFDPRRNCLLLFHHVGFLKAHMDKQQGCREPLRITLEEGLKKGNLPPQLVVETLHSLQTIIFPPTDQKSAEILENLVRKREESFDPECLKYDGFHLYEEQLDNFRYIYWAERISLLHELLIIRPPRNKLERWLEWQKSEGNAMLVALLALFISIVVGIISIGLSAVQIWIGWMAWKHPVENHTSMFALEFVRSFENPYYAVGSGGKKGLPLRSLYMTTVWNLFYSKPVLDKVIPTWKVMWTDLPASCC